MKRPVLVFWINIMFFASYANLFCMNFVEIINPEYFEINSNLNNNNNFQNNLLLTSKIQSKNSDNSYTLPLEIWEKIVSFFHGCDPALLNFFVPNGFEITKKQAKEISSLLVRKVFLKSANLEDAFKCLDNLEIFKAPNCKKSRDLVFIEVKSFSNHFKAKRDLFQKYPINFEAKIKKNLNRDFKNLKKYFKNKIGASKYDSEFIIERSKKDILDLNPKKLKNVFFKIKNKDLIYRDFENYVSTQKGDLKFIKTMTLFSLYFLVSCFASYLVLIDCGFTNVGEMFKFFCVFGLVIFSVSVAMYQDIKCESSINYNQVISYLIELEKFFQEIKFNSVS